MMTALLLTGVGIFVVSMVAIILVVRSQGRQLVRGVGDALAKVGTAQTALDHNLVTVYPRPTSDPTVTQVIPRVAVPVGTSPLSVERTL